MLLTIRYTFEEQGLSSDHMLINVPKDESFAGETSGSCFVDELSGAASGFTPSADACPEVF